MIQPQPSWETNLLLSELSSRLNYQIVELNSVSQKLLKTQQLGIIPDLKLTASPKALFINLALNINDYRRQVATALEGLTSTNMSPQSLHYFKTLFSSRGSGFHSASLDLTTLLPNDLHNINIVDFDKNNYRTVQQNFDLRSNVFKSCFNGLKTSNFHSASYLSPDLPANIVIKDLRDLLGVFSVDFHNNEQVADQKLLVIRQFINKHSEDKLLLLIRLVYQHIDEAYKLLTCDNTYFKMLDNEDVLKNIILSFITVIKLIEFHIEYNTDL